MNGVSVFATKVKEGAVEKGDYPPVGDVSDNLIPTAPGELLFYTHT
jgi:hypothetical protein